MPVFLGYFLATVKFNLSLDVILERSMYWMECSLLSAATDSDVIKLYDLTSICQQVWLVLYEDFRLCPHYARGIWKGSFISTVWLTVHTNPSRNTELFENALFKPLKFENVGRALYCGRKTFWKKKELFKNDDVTIITWFPCPRFLQTQIQTDRWLLRFQVHSSVVRTGPSMTELNEFYHKLVKWLKR